MHWVKNKNKKSYKRMPKGFPLLLRFSEGEPNGLTLLDVLLFPASVSVSSAPSYIHPHHHYSNIFFSLKFNFLFFIFFISYLS